MPDPIHGPLYRESMGQAGAPPLVFVHPNPLDSACWLFQMAHLSTWYRTIAIDLPGYGRSPSAASDVTMRDVAAACWEAVDDHSTEPAVLVGCSVGSNVVEHMYHLRPKRTPAVVLSGTGYNPTKSFAPPRIASYRQFGLKYRRTYAFEVLSPEFRETPLAHWLVDLIMERNQHADLDTIVAMFEALAVPDPEWLQRDLRAPVLIVIGSQDRAYQAAFALRDRLPDCELQVIDGAGHACQLEQPWEFDLHLIDFLTRHGLHPGAPSPFP